MSSIIAIDYGTKTLGLAHTVNNMPMPLGNLDNDGDFWFRLMGIIAQHKPTTILIGFPKNESMQTRINQFIKTLKIMYEGDIIRIDENYSSVQAQAITGSDGKHIANDTLSAMELIHRRIRNSELGIMNYE